ncbi:RNA-directed DNA polymerase, eukaryota, reverse transcriptase zinc-binding domain protein [Tanacetum coccineum]
MSNIDRNVVSGLSKSSKTAQDAELNIRKRLLSGKIDSDDTRVLLATDKRTMAAQEVVPKLDNRVVNQFLRHDRKTPRFAAMDGDLETISLGILYTSFMISLLFASLVVTKLGSKNALLLGTTDRKKENSVVERGEWVDNRDRWKLSLSEDGEFTVKELSRLIEEMILVLDNGGRETIWNKLVPKKVNIFVWRAFRGRLPVCVELDRRGVDLDSVLYPSCNNIVETCSHSLITCDLAMGVWDKIFSWWKAVCVNAFSLDEFFSSNGNVNVPTYFSCVWQAVIWSTGYFIWKERNACVFGNKISSTNKIVQDIQLRTYEWIVRRSNKYKDIDWQRWLQGLLGFIIYVTKLLRVRSGLDLVIAYD